MIRMIRSTTLATPRKPAIFGGVALLVGVLVLTVVRPQFLGDKQAYESAPLCTGAQPSPECRWRGPATVTAKERRDDGKYNPYYLRVSRSGESPRWVEMAGGTDTVSEVVEPGDTVTATYWRGLVREVAFEGRRTATEHDPAGDSDAFTFLGVVFLAAGLTSGAVAWRRWVRLRRAET